MDVRLYPSDEGQLLVVTSTLECQSNWMVEKELRPVMCLICEGLTTECCEANQE